MKQSLKFFFISCITAFIILFFSSIALAVDTYAMDVSIVSGVKDGLDVKQDFGKAVVTVSPELAEGNLLRQFHQTIIIQNKDVDQYFFLNPIMPTALKKFSISELQPYEVDVPNLVEVCTEKVELNASVTRTCVMEQQGTKKETRYNSVKINNNYATWGLKQQFYTNTGTLIKSGETKYFGLNYETTDLANKFDVRVWANTKNDWSCILDDPTPDCTFSYTIDPTYNFTASLLGYWSFDANNSVDSLGLHNGTDTTISYVAGKNSQSAYFSKWGASSNNSRISVGAVGSSSESRVTINLWIKLKTYNNMVNDNLAFVGTTAWTTTGHFTYQVWSLSSGSRANNHQLFYVYGSNPDSSGDSNYRSTTSLDYTYSTWQMITAVYNASNKTAQYYLNGTLDRTVIWSTTAPVVKLDSLLLGSWYTSGYNSFNGSLDEIAIWNRTLSPAEILLLYNNSYGCYYPFPNGCENVSTDTSNYTVTSNITYTTPVFETNDTTIAINFTMGHNITVSNVTLNTYGTGTYPNMTATSTGSCGNNCTWQYYEQSVRPPLNPANVNPALLYYNFTFNTNVSNGTIYSNSSSNYSMNVYQSFFPINIFIETPIIETYNTTWNVSYNLSGTNLTDVSFIYVTQWNVTNVTGTHTINNSFNLNSSFSYITEMLNSTDNTKLIAMTPYLNITFNGTTVSRNGSAGAVILSANQMVWKMLINNCSNASINVSVINFSIMDMNGSLVPSADLYANYTVYVSSPSLYRNYSFTNTNNATPTLCMYPNFGTMYLNWNLNYSGDGGRIGTSVVTGQAITNVSYNYSLIFVPQYNFRLFNESDGLSFNPAITTSTTLNVYCSNTTEEQVITSTTQAVTIQCTDWQFMRMYVTMNNETYYRTLRPTWFNATNSTQTIDWYLINLNVDTAVRKTFTLNDLTSSYGNGDLIIQKIIGTGTQTIHRENWDIENKVQAYFILNDLYSLSVTGDDNSTKVLGNFLADTTAQHEISIPEIPFYPEQTIDDFQWQYIYSKDNNWLYMQFRSLNGTSYNVSYIISNYSNPTQIFLNISFDTNTSGSVNFTGMNNNTIYQTKLAFNHSSYSVHLDTKLWGAFAILDSFLDGLSDPVGFKKWFAFIIIIAAGLMFSGLSVGAGAITMTTLTWVFYMTDWLPLSVGGVPGSLVLGLFTLITIGVLFVSEGIR